MYGLLISLDNCKFLYLPIFWSCNFWLSVWSSIKVDFCPIHSLTLCTSNLYIARGMKVWHRFDLFWNSNIWNFSNFFPQFSRLYLVKVVQLESFNNYMMDQVSTFSFKHQIYDVHDDLCWNIATSWWSVLKHSNYQHLWIFMQPMNLPILVRNPHEQ